MSDSSRRGFRAVGPNTSTNENRMATKSAHRPHQMPDQLAGSIKAKINSAKGGFGKVTGAKADWPTYKSK